ncbi:MAG: DUF4474 domain-containing protein [Oscillospiraceae bacterium]
MKNILIKSVSIILIVLMFTGIFSSCGGKDSDTNITRGSNEIKKPTHDGGEVTEEESSSEESTTETTAEETFSETEGTTEKDTGTKPVTTTKKPAPAKPNVPKVTPEQVLKLASTLGFEYDARQDIFYSSLDPWQREAGFISEYDKFASLGNMNYQTTRMCFNYDGLEWRFQFWKGQYGILGGAEIGVYTKPENDPRVDFYDCADDNHLIEMEYKLYRSMDDYKNGTLYFEREMQKHWWLTGFKFGVVAPQNLVLRGQMNMYNDEMADAFEVAVRGAGFERGDAEKQFDTYKRVGNDFYILWRGIGALNFGDK